MPLKLRDVVTALAAAGFIAADKKPADVEAALIALDASLPGNVAEAKEIEDRKRARDEKKAADRKARDEKVAKDRKARDEAAFEKKAADRKARDEKVAKDRAAHDKEAEDRDDDPEHTNDAAFDAEMDKEAEDEAESEKDAEDSDMEGDPSTPGGSRAGGKTAIDSSEVDARIAAAVAQDRALNTARAEVAPVVGAIAFDSASAAYRAGLKALGVDAKGVHDSALSAMFKMAKDRATIPASMPTAMDGAAMSSMDKIIPGYSRLK